MMKLQKMKKYSFIIFFFIGLTCFSQNYKGTLNPIEKNGLHKIILTSEIRAASKNNFNFIRIKDSLNQETPYVLKDYSDRFFSTFLPIKIVSNKRIKDSITAVLIENKTRKKQASLILKIANTAISKRYDLFGSNDGKKWFGIRSNKILNLNNYDDKITIEKRINFPVNAYQFLKISFNDKNSLPINILGVGVYKNRFFSEEPIALKKFSQEIIQLEDRKVTQIKFTANNKHKINSISFDITTPFFLRNAKLILQRKHTIKKRVKEYEEVVSSFQLSSKKENTFNLNNFNEKEFIIEIKNEDNPSLAIKRLELLQKPIYIISNFKKNQQYQLIIDTTFSKPSYDLGNFISENTLNMEEAAVKYLTKVKRGVIIIKKKPFWETPFFMWICIIFASFLIIYFALDLLKDLKNKEKKQL